MSQPLQIDLCQPSLETELSILLGLLGSLDCLSVSDQTSVTGCIRSASVACENSGNDDVKIYTATYSIGFPGRGSHVYKMFSLELRSHDGQHSVVAARRLGRLTPAVPLVQGMVAFAQSIAAGKLPGRSDIAVWLPEALLDEMERTTPVDLPPEGTDCEKILSDPFSLNESMVQAMMVDSNALSHALNLVVGESAEYAGFNPRSGDYRVFHMRLSKLASGGILLAFEVYRQSPNLERRIFNVFSMQLAPSEQHMRRIEAFYCDAGVNMAEVAQLLPLLAHITACIQARTQPEDALIFPMLSAQSRSLWTQMMSAGAA